jgi:predicted MFS family arabinose efflux permease
VVGRLKGKALAIAMVGTPLALSLGVPTGAFLGATLGWRAAFFAMSVTTVVLICWVLWAVPDFAGQPAQRRLSIGTVFRTPGIRPILATIFAWMTAHNILYTYVAPFAVRSGLQARVDLLLLAFGVSALAGIVVTGLLIDHLFAPRVIAVVMLLFAGGLLLLTTGHPMLALPAAFTIGFAMGAELDVLAYLVSRYFPIARFGRTYGIFYGALMAGGACSALLIAQLHARTGSYDAPLVLSAAMLALAAALFLLAPRFPSSPASS